jgi:DNA-binding transcriptional MerR regulator
MSTIGALGRRHGLSRSTLLYYDRIGVLRPSARKQNGYRDYTGSDEQRLARIAMYRKTGASLHDIRQMLDGSRVNLRVVLERRLDEINEEVGGLREQQRFILGLLESRKVASRVGVMNVHLWVKLLRASGFDQGAMNRWHAAFEHSSPESHQKFLEFLCLPEKEIARIRRLSKIRTHRA